MNFRIPGKSPHKRTKIVATIGPASSDRDVLRRMVLAGMDVVRLNFSHGNYEGHAAVIRHVRDVSQELGLPVAIMGDLRGPRIRVGEMDNGTITLEPGQKVVLTPEQMLGNANRISISFPELARDLAPGGRLLIDDGDVEMRVQELSPDGDIHCVVEEGGEVSSRRGINLPGIRVSLPSVTDKDELDVDFAIQQSIDFLALSFVQSVEDVRSLKELLLAKGAQIPVIAKIEKRGALDDLDAIVQEAYGVMVARGDLALEMSFQEMPVAQKQIIARCRQAAVPVITATQMLESMVSKDHPTRAEANDVANAVFDGTDALMLSGETAIGRYPVQSIATMASIAARAEAAWVEKTVARPPELPSAGSVDSTIAYLGHVAACRLNAAAIVTLTQSGSTARRLCRHRPPAPILALTPSQVTQRHLCLSWGVESVFSDEVQDINEMTAEAVRQAQSAGLAQSDDTVVVMAGIPLWVPGTTNLLKVEKVS